MTKTKQSGSKVPAKSDRTGYETPQITGLNMYHIFNSAATKIVFPAMQRTYSWGQEQLKRFFNNLYMDRYINQDTSAIGMFELYNSSDNPRHKKELHIFNGQQRIVTMFLILCNIRDMLSGAKAKDKIRYSSTISKINMLFFASKLPNGSYQYFKIHYEGAEDMNILLQNIADNSFIGAGNINTNEAEGSKNIRKANFFIKNWLTEKFSDDLDELHEFSKFVLDGVFFAAQYHNEINRAESAFIESNLIQVHLTSFDLLRGKLVSYFENSKKQSQVAQTFQNIDKMLRDNKFYLNEKKTRINELLFRHSTSIHFLKSNTNFDIIDFVFNSNSKRANDICEKYFEWAKAAVALRNNVLNGYEYMFLKMLAKQQVFSWTKSVVYNMIVSRGETQQNRKVLLDSMITFISLYYGNASKANITDSIALDLCKHMRENPTCSWETDVNVFYKTLTSKINEDNTSQNKKALKTQQDFVNFVIINLSEQIKSFSFQKSKPDRSLMRMVLCFIEAVLQHEITGENLYIAFKRIYDNSNVRIKQLSNASMELGSDYLNKLGNTTLVYESKKPLKLYINSNFALHFGKNKMTKNFSTVCESLNGVPNFSDVNNMNELKCKKRLEFIVAAFRHYWKPEVLVKLQASSQQRAAAARKDGVSKAPSYTARIEEALKQSPLLEKPVKTKKQLQKA
jgi:hypothetical protein